MQIRYISLKTRIIKYIIKKQCTLQLRGHDQQHLPTLQIRTTARFRCFRFFGILSSPTSALANRYHARNHSAASRRPPLAAAARSQMACNLLRLMSRRIYLLIKQPPNSRSIQH